ncbi:cell division protein FtsB [Acidovorax delafieldii]|uniref:Cell division protein FtsB n=1 Tax=Acidovorax delafieldii TaxID=47920 RepID=A0AAJ2F1G3_ACIDE|nr:Arc family DNA-binding protein [Acidovorax delafieldii]MDR6767701.1 cell division protein FtsB [Acidovorax delafieldii]MDR6839683.1 cell division protein FtsB [Acidovorax delafieldii]MDR7368416.1 cell division protein FtsB [Acidovorax delafieldii]
MASEDVQTNLRMPAELKESLQAAAERNNRSLSAEVVFRLVHSFSQDAGLLQEGESDEMRREREALTLRREVMLGRLQMLETLIAFKMKMVFELDVGTQMDEIESLQLDLALRRKEMQSLKREIADLEARIEEIDRDLQLPEWSEGLKSIAAKMPK